MKKITKFLFLSASLLMPLEASQGSASTNQMVLSRSLVDTLNVGLEDTVHIGFFPGDIMMEVYRAPGDLSLYGVAVDVHQWNTDGTFPNLKVEVYRSSTAGYPFTSAGWMYDFGVMGENGWIGYAHPVDNDSIAYPDVSSAADLIWNNFSSGAGVCTAAPEEVNGQPVWGTKVLPVGNDVMIPRPSDGSAGLFYVDFTSSSQFAKDEYIAVVVTYLADGAGDPANEATIIDLNAGDASYIFPAPGLMYYGSGCSGPSGEHGWYIMNYAWKFQYVVNIFGDIPPDIEVYHVGMSTTTGLPDPIPPYEDVLVQALVNDTNPAGGQEGVEIVGLHWQRNSLTADTNSVAMQVAYNLVIQQYVFGRRIDGYGNGTTVYWWISAMDVEGNISTTNKQSYIIGTLATDNDVTPYEFDLHGNYPNPFNPVTNIIYSMGTASDVTIMVHNIQGQLVKNLFIGNVKPGQHTVSWNGTNNFAQSVPSGIYIYSVKSSRRILVGKMMLLK